MASTRAAAIAAFGGLLIISALFKARGLGSAYWIDEGLSVGIGSHPFWDIPGLLRQDGSPFVYYMLLHVWMDLVGTTEFATQSLSAIFALLCVPAAFWAGNVMFGRRVAWAAAALTAVNPFLTLHGYEARMYALIVLLGIVTSTAFVLAFVHRRRVWLPVFGVLIAVMMYTHNWSLFLGVAAAGAFAWLVWHTEARDRRALLRDGAIGFGVAALLYAPWLPNLLYQAQHTGAPWSIRPMFDELIFGTGVTIGGRGQSAVLLLSAVISLPAIAAARRIRELRAAQSLLFLFAGAVLVAFVSSQLSPAWASRYLAVALGPLLLFSAAMLVNAGRVGMVGLAVSLALCAIPASITLTDDSDEKAVAAHVDSWLPAESLVIVTHPERVPIMRHYLGDELRYADLFGPVPNPGVMDWRDALDRIKKVRVARNLVPMLDDVPVGGRVLMVRPIVDRKANSWKAPWTKRVLRHSRYWTRTINGDPHFRPLTAAPTPYTIYKYGVRGVVYERVR